MQVFGIFLMVPADPAVKKLLPGLLFSISAVNISGIIERFQNTVVPPLLYVKFRSGPAGFVAAQANQSDLAVYAQINRQRLEQRMVFRIQAPSEIYLGRGLLTVSLIGLCYTIFGRKK